MTCKFCKTFPSMSRNSDFLKGCKTFKKETLKIHSENQKQCRDAVTVEKKEGSVKFVKKLKIKKQDDLRK